jgi:hypothetical protein
MCWKIDSDLLVLINSILFSFVMWRTFQSFSGYGVFKYCMDYDVKSYLFFIFRLRKLTVEMFIVLIGIPLMLTIS